MPRRFTRANVGIKVLLIVVVPDLAEDLSRNSEDALSGANAPKEVRNNFCAHLFGNEGFGASSARCKALTAPYRHN